MKQLKHFIFVAIIVAVLTAIIGIGLQNAPLFPSAASKQAQPIDQLFGLHMWVIAFLFSLIVGFMLYSIFVFRRKSGEIEDGDHFDGNTAVEIIWTVLPLIAVIYFAFLGGKALAETQRIDPSAMRVNVYGQQWSWRFEYPEAGISSTELVLPVNKQALLRLSSLDVIHSFWVPEFRVKQDLLPGDLVRELRITPTETGDYKVRCAELCGREHSKMLANVRVLTQDNYDAWVQEQLNSVSDDPVIRGQVWSQQYGCQACHTIDGSEGVGPTWFGIFGHDVQLADGTTVVVDEDYIYNSIVQPGSQIVAGFQNQMPANFAETLGDNRFTADERIADIIEYIKTLK